VSDKDAAWGQGTHAGNRVWKGEKGAWAPWNKTGRSNNQLSLGIEIEGRADTIDETITDAQFETVAKWIAYKAWQYSIPIDTDHVVRHSDLASDKSDPGMLPYTSILNRARLLLGGYAITTPPTVVPPETDPSVSTPVIQDTAAAYKDGYHEGYEQAVADAKGAVARVAPPSILAVPFEWKS
jgi:hypothetical protein